MKVGGDAKQNASLKQGMQVSTTTQGVATSSRHCHTVKLSGDTYQPLSLPRPAKREGREGQTATNAQFGAQNCMTFQSKYASSEA